MEAGVKDSEEEDTLQTAFKKLRVDAESRSGSVGVSVGVSDAPRAACRASLEGGGAKTKLSCPKENWHGCMRKSSRGSSRIQRRRRSKSPILQPPKFTYCSGAALPPPGGCLKQQRLAVPELPDVRPPVDGRGPAAAGRAEPGSSGPAADRGTPLVFGSCAGFEGGDGAESAAPGRRRPAEAAADFRALSELRGDGCSECRAAESQEDAGPPAAARCRCRPPPGWSGVEVYSFTGLRDAMSECEGGLQRPRDPPRTLGSPRDPPRTLGSPRDPPRTLGSPRSCSEQARGFVDDVTIEDLSGYMEFFLYFPKKMSHMAEMMYT